MDASGPQEPIDSRWDRRLGHLLWELHMRSVALFDDVFAAAPASVQAVGTMDMIAEYPGATVAELARRSPKTQQAISQMVARLVRLGYVERRLGPGRGVGLYVTAAGEDARAAGHELESEAETLLRAQLGNGLYHELRELLLEARGALAADAGAEASEHRNAAANATGRSRRSPAA